MKIDNRKLKIALINNGMRQYQLAQKVGINESNLSKIMTGRLNPGKDLLKRICEVLGIKCQPV